MSAFLHPYLEQRSSTVEAEAVQAREAEAPETAETAEEVRALEAVLERPVLPIREAEAAVQLSLEGITSVVPEVPVSSSFHI